MRTLSEGSVLRVLDLDRLSGTNSTHFKELVKAQITDAHRVVEVDFSAVRSIDSEGLGALISIYKVLAPREGRVRLLKPQAMILEFLKLVQFERIVDVVV